MKPIRLNKKLLPIFILLCLALFSAIGIIVSAHFDSTKLKPELSSGRKSQGSSPDASLVTEYANSAGGKESDKEEAEGKDAEGKVDAGILASEAETSACAVFVTGAAKNPGVYYLEAGKRIDDALNLAGGANANAHLPSVNLAAPIHDAMHIYIPTVSEVKDSSFDPIELVNSYKSLEQKEIEPSPGIGSLSTSQLETGNARSRLSSSKVNVNRAGLAELETLPGIGPATAQKIIDERQAAGPFSDADDLLRVSGIGEKKLEAMRDFLSF